MQQQQQQQPINRMDKQNSQERNPIILNSEIDFSIYMRGRHVSVWIQFRQLLTSSDEIWWAVIKRVNDIHNEVAMISPLLFFISLLFDWFTQFQYRSW